jgi:hypothetical protein
LVLRIFVSKYFSSRELLSPMPFLHELQRRRKESNEKKMVFGIQGF